MELNEFQEVLQKFFYDRASVLNRNQSVNPAWALRPPAVQAMEEIIEAVAKVCDNYANVFEDDSDVQFSNAGRWYRQTAEKIRSVQL